MFISLLAMAIIGLLGAMSPGPDFAVVTKNALTQPRSVAYCTVLGISAGVLMHTTYCIIGLAVIIAQSTLLFGILHVVGASYLIYLGVKNLRAKTQIADINAIHSAPALSRWRGFMQGFLVNALNPKCIIFLLTVYSTVIKPNTAIWLQTFYGLEIIITGLLWFCFLTFLLTQHKVKNSINRFQNGVVKLLGVFLIGFGVSLLVELLYTRII